MKKQSKKLRRVGLWGFALVFVFTLLSTILWSQVSAQSSDRAKFIDKVYIEYKNRLWKDPHPYDGIWDYEAGPSSGVDGCGDLRHFLVVENPDSNNPTARGAILSKDEFGECEYNNFDGVVFEQESLSRRFWNAYRRSANELFLPIGSRWDLGSCGINNLPRTASYQTYLTPGESKLYRRNDAREPANRYYEVNGDSLEQRNLVETDSNGTAEFVINGRCSNAGPIPDDNASRDFGGIVLAYGGEAVNGEERCIPRVYGIEGGVCTDANDPGTLEQDNGGQGDTAEDECYDNAAEEGGLGWIICDVLRYGDNFSNELLVKIRDLLEFNERDYNDPDGNMRKAWSYFRNIASFALIIIGLVMVIGQATSKE